MTKKLLLGAIFLSTLGFSPLSLEAAVIKGKILDKQEGASLAGAKIWIKGQKLNAISNKNGEFTILNVPTGKQELIISYIGYNRLNETIQVDDDNKSESLIFNLEPMSYSKEAVVVIGEQVKGQAKALNQQKTNTNITNVISADQAGKFPDANIGDAMKRITGITVQYDQGEARFGLIRGTAASLNSVTINGDRIPSAEGETRTVQLDLIPSDMISSIELNKAITPDMDADAIGGSVNLVTRNVINGNKLSLTTGSGMNFLSEKPIWNFSAVAGTRFLDDKFGVVVSGSYNNHHLGSDNVEAIWSEGPNSSAYLGELEVRKYDIQRIRQSLSAGLDYKIDENNTIFFNAMYNHRNDYENRFRLRLQYDKGETTEIDGVEYDGLPGSDGTVKDVQVVRQLKGGINNSSNDNARLEDQKTMNFSLSGEHLFAKQLKVNWQTNWAKASEDTPNERYLAYKYKKSTVKQNTSDPSKPSFSIESSEDFSKYTLDELTEQSQYTDDIDLNGKLDFELPISEGEYKNKIKFGGRIRTKDKERTNNFFTYEPINDDMATMNQTPIFDATDANFLAGDYKAGMFTTKEYLGNLDLNNSNLFEKIDTKEEYAAANYSATENIYAGYAQLEQNIGDNLLVLIGARFEQTKVNYDANQIIFDEENEDNPYTVIPTKGEKSYSNFLPAIHLKYSALENLVIRGAWTNSIARPNYYQLAPYKEINVADEEISEGNTTLNATKSMNFDLMADYYFEAIGVVSAGAFYKDIKDYIYTNVVKDYIDIGTDKTYKYYYRPENGAEASLFGFEVAFQRQLDFLPDMFKGLGFYANYTFTDSKAKGLKIAGRENEEVDLPGTAKHMLNTSLSYEMYGINLRLSLNFTNDYVDEFGASEFYDKYYDTQTFVDVNGSYEFIDGMRVYFDINNLTNQPLKYYQGKGHSDRVMQMEYYNTRVNLGLKFDL